ncbi:MAG: hypothetical protein RIN55_01495 [Tissierellaceae bacterium]|nr:hypothetical protein [Tissierellaceae bacterium]
MKRFLACILTFVIILTAIPIQGWADTLDKPIISVEDMDIPTIDAGKTSTITLNLKAIGNSAYDVVVTPVFTEPLTTNNLTNNISVGNITGSKTASLKLDLTASQNALPGNYPVELKFNFNYYTGSDVTTRQTGTYSETIYIRVSGKSTAPKLLITKVSTNPEVILPGQDVKLNVLFENKGTVDANNVNVRLEGLKSNSGFYISSGTDLKFISRVPGDMVSSLSYDLKASTNIPRGTHELELVFEYGGESQRQKIYLVVGGSNSYSSNLLMENIQYPTSGIAPNKDFVLNFDLRNNSDSDAVNVVIKAESSDSAVVPKTTSILKLNSLKAGESQNLSFTFTPTEDAITRNYPINITVEYEDDFNQGSDYKHELNQYVGMYVVNGEDSGTNKAKLIIDKYSFEPQLVKAGENFEMRLSFYNTSSTKTVKNIKIFLTSESGSSNVESNSSAFTPVNSSNTFYIDSISPKSRVEKTITMFTIPDAIAKTHTITANFEYEDSEGIEYTGITELIGVPVVQQSKLELGELSYMPEAFIGQSTPISLEFYNTGKVTLYNMMVKLEGDFQSENAQYYVGNFTSGSSEYFDGYVIPMEMGELKGDVVFTYEDSTGQMQEVRKEFSLNVVEMPVFEDPWGGEMPPMEEETSLLKSKGLWITLAVILAAIGGIVFYRKKKKNKELSLDE